MHGPHDPAEPDDLDEADVREELTRVFGVCASCRACVGRCSAFPTLFDLVDRADDAEAGSLTPSEQDRVVSACHQCKLCVIDCPYRPGEHELAVDVPRTMLRAAAMRHRHGHVGLREKLANQVLARTDLVGAVATALPALSNRLVVAQPGSVRRRITARLTGVSAVRLLPPYARQRFSTWFRSRGDATPERTRAAVTIFATCTVEYHEPAIGRDLVAVYERNGISCRLSSAGCCGAPWLHAGDVARFRTIAAKRVAALADDVRAGTDIVVPQPTCSYVLRHDVPEHVDGDDARLVARHTYDAAEYLVRLHRGEVGDGLGGLDTGFGGAVPDAVTYHRPCHLRAQELTADAADLLALTGARVSVVERCSGTDGTWGLRAENERAAIAMADELVADLRRAGAGADAGAGVVAGDCHLANTAVVERGGGPAVHPLQVLARAYGVADRTEGA